MLSRQNKNILYVLLGVTLEYFDVMLFIHLATTVSAALYYDDIPLMKSMGASFSFLTTVAFRPIGALIWGPIGDKYGRKICVTVTPLIVAFSCLAILFLPSYRDSGDFSIVLFFLLRAIAGSMWVGEKTAANIYITEMIDIKKSPFYSALAGMAESLGTVAALTLISFCLFYFPENGWRYAFMIGALIAFSSIFLRRNLEESREFLDAIQKRTQFNKMRNGSAKLFSNSSKYPLILLKFLIIEMTFAVAYFFIFIYGKEVLMKELHYTESQAMNHLRNIGLIEIGIIAAYALLSLKINGLKIVRCRILIYVASIPFIFWYYLTGEMTEAKIYTVGSLIIFLGMGDLPCLPFLLKGVPTLFRMRGFAFASVAGKVIMYGFTSVVLLYIIRKVGPICLPFFFFLIASVVAWALWTYPVSQNEN